MKFKEIIKDKKLAVRIVLFIATLVVAITYITQGVIGLLGNREKEGYQTVKALPDESAVLYASDYTLNYYFSGKSGEIKEQKNAVMAAYSNALGRAYKLFDPQNTYEGFSNIATLNQSNGVPVQVGEELYGVLKDAYARTCEKSGYNMFAGAFYDYVYSILILEDPEDFDPLNNDETAGRINGLKALTQKTEYFDLQFLDDSEYTVSFRVSPEYEKEAEQLEATGVPLDLNLLRDAYTLGIVRDALAKEGYTNGYITTKSGLTYALSAQKGLNFCIYGLQGSTPAILETLPSDGQAIYCSFKTFAFGDESMYYTVQKDGKTIYRNPYISDAGENEKFLSLYSILHIPDGSTVGRQDPYPCADTVCRNLKIWCGFADVQENNGTAFTTAYVPEGEPGTVYR